MESQILQFYRISIDSHQVDVKSLIQGTLSSLKDDLLVVLLYTGMQIRFFCTKILTPEIRLSPRR